MINSNNIEIYTSDRFILKFNEYEIIICLLMIYLFLCPFEFALNNFGGSLLKYLGLLILFLSLIWFYRTNKKMKIMREYFLLVLWVLIGLVSLLWTPGFSNGSYYALASGNIVLIITIVSCFKFKERSKNKLLISVQLSCFIFSFLMILKGNLYQNRGIRYTLFLLGKELDPNNLAGLLLPGLLISFYYVFSSKRYKLYNLIIFSSILIAIFMGGSRGGVMACTISLIFLISINLKKQKKLGRNILFIAIIFIIAYFISKTFVSVSILERLNPLTYGNDGGSDRIYLWKYGWNMIKENPIFGYGIGSYSTITGSGMHNTFLLIWFETGIIGLSLFLFSMYIMAKKMFKIKEYLGVSILIGALVCIFFLDAYQKKFLWTNILLCTIMVKSEYELNKNKLNKTIYIQKLSRNL